MTSFAPPRERSPLAGAATALALAGLVGAGLWAARRPQPRPQPGSALPVETARQPAARRARQGGMLLAASAAIDGATEHYRGGFHRWEMYLGPAASIGALAASAMQAAMPRPLREGLLLTAAGVGLAGHAFHARNILDRPGGVCWSNLFYAAPIGAPGSVALAGLAGLAATMLERREPEMPHRRGRWIAIGTVAGLLGTTAEVALLHFRGAYHNPAMYIPVTLPPIAALTLGAAAARPSPTRLRLAHRMLGATAMMGLVGTAFHAWGVHRNMGGWRNWQQNLLVAPPLPAPPGFTGVALVGLAAIDLLEASE
ncbi:hypothetical protein JSE7799_03541 [Jannaschia seosinensis]|uniref:Uncharacterized protein n=1 Tax=Jannaschia seosinensis TaxID=313367 RepID=A0A0M7BG24_9RHOB|nr:hypothetical protein [Jannaschia seosinensis]CUH40804.1 hypothetical protein JSE7799_03541 [Jannaschia seosinensis]